MLQRLVARPDHVLVAGVRDPNSSSSKSLLELSCGTDSSVILTKIDSASNTDAFTAIQSLTSEHGITRLDLVVANAGISQYFGKAAVTPPAQMTQHYRINTVGPLLLFQATANLLKAAPRPKFVAISSVAGSIGGMEKLKDVHNTAYGSSKAALNFVIKRIHLENPDLIAFALNPGWLQTDVRNHQPKQMQSANNSIAGKSRSLAF